MGGREACTHRYTHREAYSRVHREAYGRVHREA